MAAFEFLRDLLAQFLRLFEEGGELLRIILFQQRQKCVIQAFSDLGGSVQVFFDGVKSVVIPAG